MSDYGQPRHRQAEVVISHSAKSYFYMEFICTVCNEKHDDWPALTYDSPSNYNQLSNDEKSTIGSLNGDLCVITYPDQIDRFIRCTMTQQIIDSCQNLDYGLWVSLSEASLEDYSKNFDNTNHQASYFGWLSNDLPKYDSGSSIPATVVTRTGNQRPEIIPHEDFDHPFVKDYYNGITTEEAEARIREMLRAISERENTNGL